jgi:hypothetical protein
MTCDMCAGEKVPWCVTACGSRGALQLTGPDGLNSVKVRQRARLLCAQPGPSTRCTRSSGKPEDRRRI